MTSSKAALVGAKTVNGPAVERRPPTPARVMSSTKMERSGSLAPTTPRSPTSEVGSSAGSSGATGEATGASSGSSGATGTVSSTGSSGASVATNPIPRFRLPRRVASAALEVVRTSASEHQHKMRLSFEITEGIVILMICLNGLLTFKAECKF